MGSCLKQWFYEHTLYFIASADSFGNFPIKIGLKLDFENRVINSIVHDFLSLKLAKFFWCIPMVVFHIAFFMKNIEIRLCKVVKEHLLGKKPNY
jgi:hypothetical protein